MPSLDCHYKRRGSCGLIEICVFFKNASNSENGDKWFQKIPAAPAVRECVPNVGHHPGRPSGPLHCVCINSIYSVYVWRQRMEGVALFSSSCSSFSRARPWQKASAAGRGAGAGCYPELPRCGPWVAPPGGRAGAAPSAAPFTRGRGFMNEIQSPR